MSRGTIIFWLGFLLILVPFLGIPTLWQRGLVIGIGAVLILLGYIQRRSEFLQQFQGPSGERHSDTFVETTKPLFIKDTLE